MHYMVYYKKYYFLFLHTKKERCRMHATFHDEELFDTIFGYEEKETALEIRTILEIGEPLLLALQHENETYLIYVLRDQAKTTIEGLATVQEVLCSKVTEDTVSQVIKSEISIYDAFANSTSRWRTGKIAGNVFPRKPVEDMKDIEDRFPKKDVKVNEVR